jgi:hypothetical protein
VIVGCPHSSDVVTVLFSMKSIPEKDFDGLWPIRSKARVSVSLISAASLDLSIYSDLRLDCRHDSRSK